MAKTTLGTIDELLAGAIDDVDDSEARFKLRNARQLLQVIQHRDDEVDEIIDAAIDNEEVIDNLRDLGYID